MFLLLSLIFCTEITIDANQYKTAFDVKDAVHNFVHTYVLTTDNRVIQFKGIELQNIFSVSDPKSEGQSRTVSLLWVDEEQSLWVNDISQKQVRIYHNQTLLKTIKDIKVSGMFRNGQFVYLVSPLDSETIKASDLKGNITQEVHSQTIPHKAHDYATAASRSFTALPNDDLAFSYTWLNTLGRIERPSNRIHFQDMDAHYKAYWNGSRPYFRATAGISSDANGNLLILTCEYDNRSCADFILYNYDSERLIAHAVSSYSIFRYKKQFNGLFVIVSDDFTRAQIHSQFPFELKYESKP